MAPKTTDTIVIGAGHNGLIAAAALAKAGRAVVVLERAERAGGSCGAASPPPGSVRRDWSTRSGACAHPS